ncbi:MAG: hypothetical protein ACOX6I_08610 [Syntrophomonadaceae bacterium]|jgi:DNA-binding ferritin-like protein (Dps family)
MSTTKDQFVNTIKHFLAEIRGEIEAVTSPLANNSFDLPAIDRYLYEINSFYYRSFHDRFMPVYERRIEQEITSQLKISRQEEMIKKDILASLKRYAQLYNKVKTFSAILSNYRADIYRNLVVIISEKEQLPTELLYLLKELKSDFNHLEAITAPLMKVLADHDYISDRLNASIYLPAIQMMMELDFSNMLLVKNWNSYLVYLEALKILADNYQLPGEQKAARVISDQMAAKLSTFSSKIAPLQIFHNHILKPEIDRQLELISLHLDNANMSRVKELSFNLAGCLSALIRFLNCSQTYLAKLDGHLILNLLIMLPPVNHKLITELHDHTAETLSDLTQAVDELSSAASPDLKYFTTRAKHLVDNSYNYYQAVADNRSIKKLGTLYSALIRVQTNLLNLENKIQLMSVQYEHEKMISGQFLELVNELDSYLNILANTRADLERVMAPRNLNRIWKDMDIRVERVPLEKGQAFPAAYRHLIDKYMIETRVTDDRDGTILHEEGDLFIIRVDQLAEEEVPYMIISMKG